MAPPIHDIKGDQLLWSHALEIPANKRVQPIFDATCAFPPSLRIPTTEPVLRRQTGATTFLRCAISLYKFKNNNSPLKDNTVCGEECSGPAPPSQSPRDVRLSRLVFFSEGSLV